jgi:hypothetical protein
MKPNCTKKADDADGKRPTRIRARGTDEQRQSPGNFALNCLQRITPDQLALALPSDKLQYPQY